MFSSRSTVGAKQKRIQQFFYCCEIAGQKEACGLCDRIFLGLPVSAVNTGTFPNFKLLLQACLARLANLHSLEATELRN